MGEREGMVSPRAVLRACSVVETVVASLPAQGSVGGGWWAIPPPGGPTAE